MRARFLTLIGLIFSGISVVASASNATFDLSSVEVCLSNRLRSEFSQLEAPARAVTRVNLTSCCRSVRLGEALPTEWKLSSVPMEDIYAARAGWDQFNLDRSFRFEIELPPTLGRNESLAVSQIESVAEGTQSRALVMEALRSLGEEQGAKVKYLASGGFSDAFEVEIAGRAKEVMKVRRPRPQLKLFESAFRRDLALEKVAIELAEKARYEGKSFIRVEPWISSPGELSRGVIRQRKVEGPKAREIAEAAEYLVQNRLRDPARLTGSEVDLLKRSRAVLERAGLTPESALDRVAALEEFYRRTHAPVLSFCKANGIPPVQNKKKNGVIGVVGLDYNSGENVVWDPQAGVFVIFDW